MATQVFLPRQGQTVETCQLVRWMKRVGDPVSDGEPICEVETDKASFEVQSTAAGTLFKQ